LSGTRHSLTIYEVRRRNLAIAVLLRMQIEHKIDQGPLEPRAGILVESEPSARNFGRAGEVENPEFLSDIPVIFCREIKLGRIAPAADFLVVRRRGPYRHGRLG